MPLRLYLLVAAASLLSPVAALAHSPQDERAMPEMTGDTWRHGPPPPAMAGPHGPPPPAIAGPHGPGAQGAAVQGLRMERSPCPAASGVEAGPPHAMAFHTQRPPELMGAPPPVPMGPPPMAMQRQHRDEAPLPPSFEGPPAGPPPCGPCLVRRPVRLHDGWLSWPGKRYF